ncbi:interleukin-19 isoform X1 [Loxodonta africana]|uniref:interleukin-19 isoform X1 n=1 Tax=Loxodonta africana TaxID=9785 RepID=UPI0030CE7717
MKMQVVSLCLLGTMLFLCSVHARSLKRCPPSMDMNPVKESFQEIKGAIQANDTFKNVTILSNLHSIKPIDVCCMTRELLEFYMKRVFKHREELSLQISREVSSISNSFLPLQRTVQPCKKQSLCPCSEEAISATRTIINNYDQLEVRSAAIKSLGELDVFIAWIDKNYHSETSTA